MYSTGGNCQSKYIFPTDPESNNPCVHLPSLLELSLPQFSLSLTNDMRDLLTNMNPELEAKLLGSEAEFSRLSSANPFTVDQVRDDVVSSQTLDSQVLC